MSSGILNLSDDDRELVPRFHEILSCAEDGAYVAQAHGDVGFTVDYVNTIGASGLYCWAMTLNWCG